MAGEDSRHNAMPEFVELLARLDHDEDPDGGKFIRVELRFQPADLEDEDGNVLATISLTRAVLSLTLGGLDVVPGSRLHEPTKGAGLTIKTAMRETVTSSAKVDGKANFAITATGQPDASVSAGASGSKEKTSSHTREVDLEHHHIYVKARGNNTWEITEADGSKLDGTYLNDDRLCQFILRQGANRAGVSSAVEIKQKDIDFDFGNKGRLSFLSNNKKKLIGILLAKSINRTAEEYSGKIVLSRSDNEYE